MMSNLHDPFFSGLTTNETSLPSTGARLRLPLRYYDLSAFSALFSAPAEAVQAALPSSAFRLPEIAPGRVAVAVTAYDYRRSDLAPYRELGAFVSVSFDAGAGHEAVTGLYCLTLPVTTDEARVAGVDGWGFPKYLAEIVIEEDDAGCRCWVSGDGEPIVTLEVGAVPVKDQPERRDLPMLTVQGNEVLHIPVVSEGRRGERGDGDGVRLIVGSHPMATIFRRIEIGAAVGQFRSVEVKAVLPAADCRFPLPLTSV